jgi:hypothetical protein
MMIVEQSVVWELAGETEVLGETLPQCHFVRHKSHVTRLGLEPELPLWEAADMEWYIARDEEESVFFS